MKPVLAALALLAAGTSAFAQIKVAVEFDQDQFLPGEKLTAKVRVSNFSGQTLAFGETSDWLVLHVESREGHVVEKNGEVPVIGKFDLESSNIATKRVNLAPHFNLMRPGRYVVRATVKVPQWGRDWTSDGAGISVIKGAKIWEQDFGVPRAGGVPELRKFALVQANYLQQMTLYARVTDAAELRVHRVEPIGPLVSFSKPEAQVDGTARLHVLWQAGANSFLYVVWDADGETRVHQRWEITDSRPRLKADASGEIIIAGGARRVTREDVPPVEPSTPSIAPPPAPPE